MTDTPLTDGVNETEQLPEDRVQVVDENEPSPLGLAENLTVPVGRRVAPPLSDTVAVQVDATFLDVGFGEQLTMVVVAIWVAVSPVLPELPLWVESPL